MVKQILCCAALLGVTGIAHAGFVTQAFTVPLETTNLHKSFTYDLFDDRSGSRTLESVEISLSSIASGISFVENQDRGAATIVANLSAEISLLDAIGNVIVSTQPNRARTEVLAGFDGTLDFSGPSGTQFFEFDAAVSASKTFIDPTALLSYIGTDVTTSTIDFTAIALSYITGAGNITSGFNTLAGGDFTIVYNYSEVPVSVSAPATLGILSIGLFTVVSMRKYLR